jgi:hypothetical protein
MLFLENNAISFLQGEFAGQDTAGGGYSTAAANCGQHSGFVKEARTCVRATAIDARPLNATRDAGLYTANIQTERGPHEFTVRSALT